ncbi:MAG: hypothetical protein Q7U14_03820, partial [Lacisediminimonas sp.]|nr:hypothetical protein [Lacisediminimonas sp.]
MNFMLNSLDFSIFLLAHRYLSRAPASALAPCAAPGFEGLQNARCPAGSAFGGFQALHPRT